MKEHNYLYTIIATHKQTHVAIVDLQGLGDVGLYDPATDIAALISDGYTLFSATPAHIIMVKSTPEPKTSQTMIGASNCQQIIT